METLSGDPAPRARCNASFLRAEARFHLKLLSADDKSIAPVVDECAALGENFAANFARLVLARYLVEHGRHVEAGKLLTAHARSEEHTSELQSLMRISYAVFCLK